MRGIRVLTHPSEELCLFGLTKPSPGYASPFRSICALTLNVLFILSLLPEGSMAAQRLLVRDMSEKAEKAYMI